MSATPKDREQPQQTLSRGTAAKHGSKELECLPMCPFPHCLCEVPFETKFKLMSSQGTWNQTESGSTVLVPIAQLLRQGLQVFQFLLHQVFFGLHGLARSSAPAHSQPPVWDFPVN